VPARLEAVSLWREAFLVEVLNLLFPPDPPWAQPGGAHGGGATLTRFGQQLVERYRAIETDALDATRKHLSDLEASLKGPGAQRASAPLKRSVSGSTAKKPAERTRG
jgi:molybdate transport system regulatory protein